MAYGGTDYAHSLRNKIESSGTETNAKTTYTDMLAIYGTSGTYSHLQQYLSGGDTTQNNPASFKTPRLTYQHFTNTIDINSTNPYSSSYVATTDLRSDCSTQPKRTYTDISNYEINTFDKTLYKSRDNTHSDSLQKTRTSKQYNESVDNIITQKLSSSSQTPLLDGSTKIDNTAFQCLGVGSCVC